MTTTADANELAAHYISVMDALLDVIQQETELVRAGHLAQAAALEQTKTELSRLYIADTLRLRANRAQIDADRPGDDAGAGPPPQRLPRPAPDQPHGAGDRACGVGRASCAAYRASSPARPRRSTYGASGRANAPDPRNATPMAVSRVL